MPSYRQEQVYLPPNGLYPQPTQRPHDVPLLARLALGEFNNVNLCDTTVTANPLHLILAQFVT
jgi:hypothetical protein